MVVFVSHDRRHHRHKIKNTVSAGMNTSYNYQSRSLGYPDCAKPRRHFWSNSEVLASSVQTTYILEFVPGNSAINTPTLQSGGGSCGPRQTTLDTKNTYNKELSMRRCECELPLSNSPVELPRHRKRTHTTKNQMWLATMPVTAWATYVLHHHCTTLNS